MHQSPLNRELARLPASGTPYVPAAGHPGVARRALTFILEDRAGKDIAFLAPT